MNIIEAILSFRNKPTQHEPVEKANRQSEFLLLNLNNDGTEESPLRLLSGQKVVIFNEPTAFVIFEIEKDGRKAHVGITLRNPENPNEVVYFVNHLWNPNEVDAKDQFTRVLKQNEGDGEELVEAGGKKVIFDRHNHVLSFPNGKIIWKRFVNG